MSVCATCYQPGITAGGHDCPGPQHADIVFTRHRGQGITVDTAPPRTRIALQALMDRYAYLHMPAPDTIVFADPVVYRITGYQEGALELELIEDWRKPGVITLPAPMSDAEIDAFKARWQATHGKPGTAHPVVELHDEEEPGA